MAPQPLAGLYDPRFEHDACGLAALVRLDGRPATSWSSRPCARSRTSTTAAPPALIPETGDGAGIMTQLPAPLPARGVPRGARPRAAAAGRLRDRARVPAARPRPAACAARSCASASAPRRASGRSAGATCRSTPTGSASSRGRPSRSCASSSSSAGRGDAGGVRAQAVRDPPPGRAGGGGRRRARGGVHRSSASRRSGSSTRASCARRQLARLLRRPARPALRERARARPQPLLDQHVRHLGPGAPVQPPRPQRRDQHGPRQRQLARRPRAAAALGGCSGDDLQKLYPIVDERWSDSAKLDAARRAARARRALAGACADHARAAGVDRPRSGRPTTPCARSTSTRAVSPSRGTARRR